MFRHLINPWILTLILVISPILADSFSGGGSGGSTPSTTILSGSITALPAAGTTGRLYIPTDSYYEFLRDTGSAWQYFMNGQLITPPTAGNFAWANQGTATATAQTNGPIVLSFPCATGTNIRLYYITAPGTPYTRTFIIRPNINLAATMYYGVGFMESGTGKLTVMIHGSGVTNLNAVYYYTNFTTFSSSPVNLEARNYMGSNGVILRLGDDGTNITYSISTDGINFETFSTLRGAFFTTAPDRVGVFGDCESTTNFTTDTVSFLSVQ